MKTRLPLDTHNPTTATNTTVKVAIGYREDSSERSELRRILRGDPKAAQLATARDVSSDGQPGWRAELTAAGAVAEAEADQAAAAVLARTPRPLAAAPTISPYSAMERTITTDGATPDASLRLGAGQPLPPPLRSFFDSRFGHDFGGVRLHVGSAASGSVEAQQARAYASG